MTNSETEDNLSLTEFEFKKRAYDTADIFSLAIKKDIEQAIRDNFFEAPFTPARMEQFFWRELDRLIVVIYRKDFQ